MGLYQNRMVIKIGTSTLINENGKCDFQNMERLARVLSAIRNKGYELVLVSSGAIAIGANKLNMQSRPDNMRLKQAAAAVGQGSLIAFYDRFFRDYDQIIAQILLSASDRKDETKKNNLVNTFDTLLNLGVIPIVNENDSVDFSEIESEDSVFGDNDMLSAIVAVICHAKRLVVLSDIDGLFEKDSVSSSALSSSLSNSNSNNKIKLIEQIDRIDENIFDRIVLTNGSRRGFDGIKTKLQAASYATNNGIDTIIANGKRPELLYQLIDNDKVGTLVVGR